MPYNNKQKKVPAIPIFSKNNVSSDITQEVSDLTSFLHSGMLSNCEVEESPFMKKQIPNKISKNHAVLRLKMEQILCSENVDDSGVGAIQLKMNAMNSPGIHPKMVSSLSWDIRKEEP